MIYSKKKLAVCILTHNRLDFLKKTINSVLKSDFDDYEIFVLNDNSNDGTNEYLDSLKKNGLLSEIRHDSSLGQFGNANFVLENLKAKYCIILHDDDTIEPDHLKEAVFLAEKDSEIAVIGTFYRTVDENDIVIDEITNPYVQFLTPVILNDREFFYHHVRGLSFTWSGSLLRMNKVNTLRFRTDSYFADWIFLANSIVNNKFGFIPKPNVNYRIPFNRKSETDKMSFDMYVMEWLNLFNVYRELILNNNYGKDILVFHKKASTKTLFSLLLRCRNFKSYFRILFSRFFDYKVLSGKNWLQVYYKFLKLCVGK